MSLSGKTIAERIDRILELPELAETEGRQLSGLKIEREKQELKIKAHEALLYIDAMQLPEYQACKTQKERDAVVENHKRTNDVWEALVERKMQLTILVEQKANRKERLLEERKALKAALEREYAAVIEQLHHDKALVSAISGRRLAA